MKMIKTFILSLTILLFWTSVCLAQDTTIVKWTTQLSKIKDHHFSFKLKGEIKPGWHLYAKDVVDDIPGILIRYNDSSIKKNDIVFNAAFKSINDPLFDNKKKQVVERNIEMEQEFHFTNTDQPFLNLKISYDCGYAANYIQEEQLIKITIDSSAANQPKARIRITSIDINHPLNNCGIGDQATSGSNKTSNSLWSLFFYWISGWNNCIVYPLRISNDSTYCFFFYQKSDI